jgi:hypothetical protein
MGMSRNSLSSTGTTGAVRSITGKLSALAGVAFAIGATAMVAQTTSSPTENLDGRWAATITQGGVTIPFRLDISGSGSNLVGKLYNGSDDYETTTSASAENGTVQLNFLHYLTSITAKVKEGELDGQLTVTRRSPINITPGATPTTPSDTVSPFHAKRYVAPSAGALANVPNIDGTWIIPHDSPKGEKAWRLIVQQKGAEITTTVLRVDGDTGALTGAWQDGKFVASHFDGARPGLIQITPQSDGSLQIVLNAEPRNFALTAYRPEVARAKGYRRTSEFPDTHERKRSE